MPETPSNLVDQEPDEWLPPGWTVKAKIRPNLRLDKYYFSPSGERFNSKVGVCRYLGLDPKTTGVNQQAIIPFVPSNSSTVASSVTTEASTLKTPSKTISPKLKLVAQSTASGKSHEHGRGGEGDYSPGKVYFERFPADGLPTGWIKEIKIQIIGGKIRRDPFYYSPSGERFNSKIMVCRHLGLDPKSTGVNQQPITPCVQSNSITAASSMTTEASTPKTPRKTISPKLKPAAKSTPSEKSQEHVRGGESDYSPGKVYFERVPVDGLPTGWIKEFKIQKVRGKIRRDPYFTDPVSGYVFRSMKDSLRFIETGDPGRLAFKPKTPVAAETMKIVGNKRKRQRSDDPARKSNEITPDEKDSKSALSHGTIRKSIKKVQLGARVAKTEKEHSLTCRSSGRLTALKEKTAVQITEKNMTENHANTEVHNAFSYETTSCRTPSKSLPNTDSAAMTSILPGNTGNGNKRGYKSPLVMSYEESWLDTCIDFAVQTLTEDPLAGKELGVNDFNGQSEGDVDEGPPGFGSNVSRAKLGNGKWNKGVVPPVNMGMPEHANVENSGGSGSMPNWVRRPNVNVENSGGSGSRPNWVRGTDRSLFR